MVVEADDDRSDVLLELEVAHAGCPVVGGGLVANTRALDAHLGEFFLDAVHAHDVGLLVEVAGFEVNGRRVAGGEELVHLRFVAEFLEFLHELFSRFGGVVGREDNLLAHLPQFVQGLGHPGNRVVVDIKNSIAVREDVIEATQELFNPVSRIQVNWLRDELLL